MQRNAQLACEAEQSQQAAATMELKLERLERQQAAARAKKMDAAADSQVGYLARALQGAVGAADEDACSELVMVHVR